MSQRAIRYFQEQAHTESATIEDLHYYNKAVRALEKQVPIPVNHEKTFWTYKHYCPSCSTMLDREALKYCPYCGQKLDWGNYWEALK
jgi:rubrerythrin